MMYLKNGKVESTNEINKTIDHYLNERIRLNSFSEYLTSQRPDSPDSDFILLDIKFFQDSREVFGNISNGKDLEIEIQYELYNKLDRFRVYSEHFMTKIVP